MVPAITLGDLIAKRVGFSAVDDETRRKLAGIGQAVLGDFKVPGVLATIADMRRLGMLAGPDVARFNRLTQATSLARLSESTQVLASIAANRATIDALVGGLSSTSAEWPKILAKVPPGALNELILSARAIATALPAVEHELDSLVTNATGAPPAAPVGGALTRSQLAMWLAFSMWLQLVLLAVAKPEISQVVTDSVDYGGLAYLIYDKLKDSNDAGRS